jgi:hypothetical protein
MAGVGRGAASENDLGSGRLALERRGRAARDRPDMVLGLGRLGAREVTIDPVNRLGGVDAVYRDDYNLLDLG